MDQDKKQKAIEVAIEQIKKQTKDPEAVVRLGDEGQKKYSKGAISTGSLSLDSSIGIGGVPKGKIIEVHMYALLNHKRFLIAISLCPHSLSNIGRYFVDF